MNNLKKLIAWPGTGWIGLGAVMFLAFIGYGLFGHSAPEPRRWAHVLVQKQPGFDAQLKVDGTDWSAPHLSAYSIATLKPPHVSPTLRDLADHGQAQAIDYLAMSTKESPHQWTGLLAALADPNDLKPGENDPFKFDRTFVATVTKGADWLPGDRMVWTRIFIQPLNFNFTGYTVAATENETVKIASVEATSTRKFSADIGLTIPGVEGPKASGGPSSENTVKATSDINAQYEKLGIDIERGFLRIVRESETGGDVLGNTTVALSVVTDPTMIFGGMVDREQADDRVQETENELVLLVTQVNAEEGAPGSGKAKDAIAVLPQPLVPHCPLTAKVWMLYEERKIDTGHDRYSEGQQRVTLLRGYDNKKPAVIVPADEVSPAVWSIQFTPEKFQPEAGNSDLSQSVSFVHAKVDTGQARKLVFTDFGMASRFAHVLRLHSIGHNGWDKEAMLGNLNFDYPKGASFSPFKTSNDECDPGYKRATSRGHSQQPKTEG
jgi:hypothetical protein